MVLIGMSKALSVFYFASQYIAGLHGAFRLHGLACIISGEGVQFVFTAGRLYRPPDAGEKPYDIIFSHIITVLLYTLKRKYYKT